MAKAYPKEFRDDVVAVARKGQAPLAQIARDFGISEGTLSNWLKRADVQDGHRPGRQDCHGGCHREPEGRPGGALRRRTVRDVR